MKLSKLLLGLTGCFFAGSLSGCFFVADPGPSSVATGSITVELSLDGSSSPSECDYFQVDGIEVEIFDEVSSVIRTDTDCGNMGMTIDNLEPGRYTVKANLLDINNRVVSDIISVENTPVSSDTDSVVKIDFPAKWIH